jgi:hypothetical protein
MEGLLNTVQIFALILSTIGSVFINLIFAHGLQFYSSCKQATFKQRLEGVIAWDYVRTNTDVTYHWGVNTPK